MTADALYVLVRRIIETATVLSWYVKYASMKAGTGQGQGSAAYH